MSRKNGFTLIELLVVITIIVVLLALLTPALDKAIYQAELAACGAQSRAIAMSVQIYAASHKRNYPNRIGLDQGDYWTPHRLSNGAGIDERPVLKEFMSINDLLNDPFVAKVDLAGSESSTQVFSTYFHWFGFGYRGRARMNKIGDRFSWAEGGNTHSFNILVSDVSDIRLNDGTAFEGHPDHDGKLELKYGENVGLAGIDAGPVSRGLETYTFSQWRSSGWVFRGGEDYHFAYDDGSVKRVENVRVNTAADPDDRMVKVGHYDKAPNTAISWTQLPLQ